METKLHRSYKIIRAPDLDRLQSEVNKFLGDPANDGYIFLEGPQVFGHEEYIQTFVDYGEDF